MDRSRCVSSPAGGRAGQPSGRHRLGHRAIRRRNRAAVDGQSLGVLASAESTDGGPGLAGAEPGRSWRRATEHPTRGPLCGGDVCTSAGGLWSSGLAWRGGSRLGACKRYTVFTWRDHCPCWGWSHIPKETWFGRVRSLRKLVVLVREAGDARAETMILNNLGDTLAAEGRPARGSGVLRGGLGHLAPAGRHVGHGHRPPQSWPIGPPLRSIPCEQANCSKKAYR